LQRIDVLDRSAGNRCSGARVASGEDEMPIHATDPGWVLETWTTGYALGLNSAGLLIHR
jgi:hypothetical protein